MHRIRRGEMAVNLVRVVTLSVGQGMCNMVEIYDDGELANLIMCDCGSLKAPLNWNGSDRYFAWIYKTFPCLSALFISHGDADHINGLDIRLEGLDISGCKVWIPESAGIDCNYVERLRGVKGSNGCLTQINTENIHSLPSVSTSFVQGDLDPVYTYNEEVKFYILGAGMSLGTNVNDNSLSVALSFKDRWILLPGDSTGESFVNIRAKLEENGYALPLKNFFMVSAPHHGSSATICRSNFNSEDFKKLIQTNWVEASAYDQHCHPNGKVLLDIINNIYDGGNHSYRVYRSGDYYEDRKDAYHILTNLVSCTTWTNHTMCYCFEIHENKFTRIGHFDAYANNWEGAPPWQYNMNFINDDFYEIIKNSEIPTGKRDYRKLKKL